MYQKLMCTLGPLLAPLLPQLLSQLSFIFSTTPVVGPIDCVKLALESYGAEGEGEVPRYGRDTREMRPRYARDRPACNRCTTHSLRRLGCWLIPWCTGSKRRRRPMSYVCICTCIGRRYHIHVCIDVSAVDISYVCIHRCIDVSAVDMSNQRRPA